MSDNKPGRLSNEQKAYIKKHLNDDPAEIAAELHKQERIIKKYIRHIRMAEDEKQQQSLDNPEFDIRKRPWWKNVCQQFSVDEQRMIMYSWDKLIAQFKEDVLATEEMQILDLCKIDVLINRQLFNESKCTRTINELEAMLAVEKEKDFSDPDRSNNIIAIETQIGVNRAAQTQINKTYELLVKQKAATLKDIKGTRDQRFQKIDDAKQSFSGFLKKIISDKSFRVGIGLELEKMRLSAYKELVRVSQYHQFEDQTVDLPFLTPETVKAMQHAVEDSESYIEKHSGGSGGVLRRIGNDTDSSPPAITGPDTTAGTSETDVNLPTV